MTGPSEDHPNVIVFPPLIPLATLALALVLQWLLPLGLLARLAPAWRVAIGGGLLLVGGLVILAAMRALQHRGTNLRPSQPANALMSEGIYRHTRNPMYVGGAPLMIGLALVFALDWLPLLMIPAAFVLHVGIVRREEQYLERKFGDTYRHYMARVPRYLGPTR